MTIDAEIVDILRTLEGILRDAIGEQGFIPRLNRVSDRISAVERQLQARRAQTPSPYDLSARKVK